MLYKRYGNSDVELSAIGMGCMRFDDHVILENKFEKYVELILYAHENGINYFDTAPFYCHDKSEIITGMALSQLPRSSYYVASKTNLATLQNECTVDGFRRRLETSLKRLKVDYLDFYYLWCMLDLNSFYENCEKLFGFFQQAKSEGLIRRIVMSSHMQGDDLVRALDTKLFEGVALGYNALNYRYRKSGIEAAYNSGMGISVMNPLGGGVIVDNPRVFKFLTEGTNLNVAQGGLRFVAAQKEVSVTMTGFTTKKHVNDAVKAIENLEIKPMAEICKEYENKGIILNDLCTGCGYCNHCPQNIEIPKFMDAYNDKLLGRSIVKRLRRHWHLSAKAAVGCIKCGKCEKMCTQHLPIIERIQEIASL
ncbi:aldo/keto reductase [Ruminiclostridium cellulolyticum]|uniref:Aldo/keto reductase n=1 Tax=Ruminiclostridium cellulolyticum (strain ATCC 35319 / DSM 5812 / JCM 6584 / H10) TaxID=394503 RepID=B8I0Y3_RUMCH|nr:aldo/keto reductase [Ruminiclostridium cellulolyticum]ACL77539.1 aldo/keto reductase [Ruminiclostridium cellulolyticum H10]